MNDHPRPEITLTWIRRAARGELRAERRLIDALTPIIRLSVARTMRRHATRQRHADQEVDDVVQSVLLRLFASDGSQPLLRWDPARGLDVAGFVSLLASHEAASILRNRRRNPWTEEPTQVESLHEVPASAAGPESLAGSRRLAAAVDAGVRARVSPRGQRMFELLFLEGRTPPEVAALTGVGLAAVYAWSSRLAQLARQVLAAPPPFTPRRRGAARASCSPAQPDEAARRSPGRSSPPSTSPPPPRARSTRRRAPC